VTLATRRAPILLALGLAGCAARAEVLRQDRQLRNMIQDQGRQLQAVQRELERLRADMEEGKGGHGGRPASDERLSQLEERIAALELRAGVSPPAIEAVPPTAVGTPAPVPVSPPPAAAPPAVASGGEEDPWRREVAREQAAAGAVNVPERAEYLGLLDAVARQDCAKAVPQLNSFAANHKDSPLADNALYWAGRCYALRRDSNQAISKFYDLVQRYPKGDKAPAALWAQGNLFVDLGDTPDARLAFSKLIRDYPASEEAGRARQKLSELEN
jgi:tol-pal system protein YbgF